MGVLELGGPHGSVASIPCSLPGCLLARAGQIAHEADKHRISRDLCNRMVKMAIGLFGLRPT